MVIGTPKLNKIDPSSLDSFVLLFIYFIHYTFPCTTIIYIYILPW